MDILNPNTGTIFWTVITFILLAIILKKLAWKPILETLEDRENRIKVALYKAEQDQKDAEKFLQQQKNILEKTRKESQSLINESRQRAEDLKKEILEHARLESEQMLSKAKLEIDNQKNNAITEIKKHVVSISIAAAKKVLQDSLKPDEHEKLFEYHVDKLTN